MIIKKSELRKIVLNFLHEEESYLEKAEKVFDPEAYKAIAKASFDDFQGSLVPELGELVRLGKRTIPANAGVIFVGIAKERPISSDLGPAIVKRGGSTSWSDEINNYNRENNRIKLAEVSDLEDYDLIEEVGGVTQDYESLAKAGKLAIVRKLNQTNKMDYNEKERLIEDLRIFTFDVISLASVGFGPIGEAVTAVLDLSNSITYYGKKEYGKSFLYLTGMIPIIGEVAKRVDSITELIGAGIAARVLNTPDGKRLMATLVQSTIQLVAYLQTSDADSIYNEVASHAKKAGITDFKANASKIRDIIAKGKPVVEEKAKEFLEKNREKAENTNG